MSMSDPLGDMLTRIRNGQYAQKDTVNCPASKLKASVLEVLQKEGFIRGYKVKDLDNNKREIQVDLKYDHGEPVIKTLHRVSKPGCRVYSAVSELPRYYGGLGVTIVSTPQGVMADQEARTKNIGGEVLCQIF